MFAYRNVQQCRTLHHIITEPLSKNLRSVVHELSSACSNNYLEELNMLMLSFCSNFCVHGICILPSFLFNKICLNQTSTAGYPAATRGFS